MKAKDIKLVIDECICYNCINEKAKPTLKQIKNAKKEGRIVASNTHVFITSNNPRESFICRK